MQNDWQVQEAKAKFSAVIAKAQEHGPQTITRHGERVAVVLSARDYDRLAKPKMTLVSFLAGLDLSELDLERDRSSLPRGLDL